jgi:hypothetical protein
MSSRAATGVCYWAAVMLASLVVGGCVSAPPLVVALPNGYYLQRDRHAQVELIKRGGRTIVRGPIAAYAVSGEVVGGCVGVWARGSYSYPNDTPMPDSPDCRYFILDTASGRLETGLDATAWHRQLKEVGAPESFPITAPVLPT